MNLYIVRHGETEGNMTGVVVGRSDEGLTARGISQMEQVRDFLKDVRFEGLYVSPTARTLQSAKIVRPSARFVVEPRISERDLGDLPPTAIEELWGMEDWNSMTKMRTEAGTETLLAGYKRVMEFLGELANEYGENDDVLLVTHSFVSRCVYMIMNGITDEKKTHDFLHPNAEVKIYKLDKNEKV